MTKQTLLNPTADYVFGRIFGYKGNEKVKIAKIMLKEGSNIEFIIKCTELTKEEKEE